MGPDGSVEAEARILFVDDEPLVVRSLRRMLAARKLPWAIHFSDSGDAALTLLARESFDVVVSDLLMPGMDGAALLARVQADHPDVARVVLSGHSDHRYVSRSVPVAHLSLPKPFETSELIAGLGRAIALGRLLAEPRLQALVSEDDARRPSAPPTYVAIARALGARRVDPSEVARLLEADPRVRERVVRLSDLSHPEGERPRARLSSQLSSLDPGAVRALVLLSALEVQHASAAARSGGFSLEAFERHAALVALLARRIAGTEESAESAYAAALLHDVGELVLAALRPEEAARALAGRGSSDVTGAERALLGACHAEVGAHLLGLFGVRLETIDAVRQHHDPGRAGADEGVVVAVHLANLLARDPEAIIAPHLVRALDADGLGPLYDGARVHQWRRAAREGLLATHG